MKIRIKYRKTEAGRFLSHLDMIRVWERAFRRGRIPVAFSQGFNPHPKFSFASALPVGVTGDGEYMEVEISREMDIGDFLFRLGENLPEVLEVVSAAAIEGRQNSLTAGINAGEYSVTAELSEPITGSDLENILESLKKEGKIIVERETKRGKKEMDIRPGIFSLEGRTEDGQVFLDFMVRTGSTGNIRPGEVVAAAMAFGLPLNKGSIRLHRRGLFVCAAGEKKEP